MYSLDIIFLDVLLMLLISLGVYAIAYPTYMMAEPVTTVVSVGNQQPQEEQFGFTSAYIGL